MYALSEICIITSFCVIFCFVLFFDNSSMNNWMFLITLYNKRSMEGHALHKKQ